jgi:5-formyltetrahydrofolate cyclo-ligase
MEGRDMTAIRAAKKELRRVLKQKLATVEKDSVASQCTLSQDYINVDISQGWCFVASKIVKSLFALPEYQHAKRISVYLSMPSGEANTPVIVRHALGAGKRVFVPYFYSVPGTAKEKKGMVMDMLELTSLTDFDELKLDSWDIPTPSEESIPHRANCFGGCGKSIDMPDGQAGEGLDVVVTPGLAFDTSLGRLGRGKGFYDRFFGRCQKESALGAKSPWKGNFGPRIRIYFILSCWSSQWDFRSRINYCLMGSTSPWTIPTSASMPSLWEMEAWYGRRKTDVV